MCRAVHRRWGAALVAAAIVATGCSGAGDASANGSAPSPTVTLPAIRLEGRMPLEEAIAGRRSMRDFTGEPLGDSDLGRLLWACQGETEEGGRGRAAPSAGGTYPLEVYVAGPSGLSRYLPQGHALMLLGDRDLREPLAAAAGGQQHVADAAAVVVIAADAARTEEVYGGRAERYVFLEAGHAAQNLLLQAVALGLGAVPVGAFDDAAVSEVIGLPAEYSPLYLIPVGHPAGG